MEVDRVPIEAIDEAIAGLDYPNKGSAKQRLLEALRDRHGGELHRRGPVQVDPDELVQALWNTGPDPDRLRRKRRNLYTLRSSINADLKRLYRRGRNPHGVVIGTDFTFGMCEEAKDGILARLRAAAGGQGLASPEALVEILEGVHDLLSNPEVLASLGVPEAGEALARLKAAFRALSDRLGSGHEAGAAEGEGRGGGEAPLEVLGEDEELEEVLLEEDSEEAEEAPLEPFSAADGPVEAETAAHAPAGPVEVLGEDEEVEEVLVVEEGLESGEGREEGEELEEALIEEAVEAEGEGRDAPSGIIVGSDFLDPDRSCHDDGREARRLADAFEGYLAARERFYNRYVPIPAGEYIVGAAPGRSEPSQVRVPVETFSLGVFPVTNALFEVFVEETGYRTTAERRGYGHVYFGRVKRVVHERTGTVSYVFHRGPGCQRVRGACWYRPWGPGSSLHGKKNHPVVQVSIEDAMAFAAWTGRRLPTEIEWEAAMRGPDGHAFPWGNEWKKDACNVNESLQGDTTPVDRYLEHANPFGIADGLGNVLEWTGKPLAAPGAEGEACTDRIWVAKGASWLSDPGTPLWGSHRLPADTTSNILGFRLVAD